VLLVFQGIPKLIMIINFHFSVIDGVNTKLSLDILAFQIFITTKFVSLSDFSTIQPSYTLSN